MLIVLAARRGSRSTGTWLSRVLLLLLSCYILALYGQKAGSGILSWSSSLPMQLCDWVLIACLASLLRPNPFLTEIAYFWGMSGTLQALLTPDRMEGFPSWRFVQFFWGHGIALLCLVYFIAARGWRPRRRSVLRMMLALQVYSVAAFSLDAAFGWNYGYMLHKPEGASLYDFLGPWPWYLLSLEGIGLVNFWLLDLPFRFRQAAGVSPRRRREAAQKAERARDR
jgi:hypothetical integral membrane protein (TIGR02206 family)